MKSSRARTDRSSRVSIESGVFNCSYDSPSYSISTPALSPEPLHLPEGAQSIDVQESWMETLWLEDPSWQWAQGEGDLAPAQQNTVPTISAVRMTQCNMPAMPAWQMNIDPSLSGSYLLPPALYHDSDGYSHSTPSPSYSTASMDSPLPTPSAGPHYNATARSALPKEIHQQNTTTMFPLWNPEPYVDTIL
ncbi:hypothetical protein Slin15195_G046870 [Septoria linicola]|uniref:Uncharacterized protein n=1 Tax=Septoria linicola TaxID=215465 RepID=A0A9Q9AQQ2_9PEZI|nr:hypothetical protein Slin15195_G046870 [Septoria linicola]